MITFRKTVAVLLCMIFAFGCFAVAAGAYKPDAPPNQYIQKANGYLETAQENLAAGDVFGAAYNYFFSIIFRQLGRIFAMIVKA